MLRLYNTLTRSVESFHPLAPPAVTIYVCGPTVYDDPHIGHARSAYIFDVLRRHLATQSFDGKPARVRFVRNVTDVDDKIIDRARQEPGPGDLNAKCREVAQRYLTSYHATMDRLGIRRPDVEPRATERVVPDMTDFISTLLMQGAAYEAQGDVYFAVRKFPGYGTLSQRAVDDLQAGARIEPGERKQDPLDFALWKAAKPDEPSWKSPWGAGRPGWHIECSAMSTKELGDEFDIHGGGVDLVFPHHENEMAQAQAAGKPFARTWVHNGLLTVNGEKMSKSLGNYITVDEALKHTGNHVGVLKLFFLGTHYRSPIDYSLENIKAASRRYDGLYHFFLLGQSKADECNQIERHPQIDDLKQEFEQAMDDDMNTPRALAALDKLASLGWQWRIDITANKLSEQEIRTVHGGIYLASNTLRDLAESTFGVTFQPREIPQAVLSLVNERENARKQKDFRRADDIRRQLSEAGYVIEDGSSGPMIVPKR